MTNRDTQPELAAELRRAKAELAAAQARYLELYDLAPVGYFTVSEQELLLEVNLTAAALLDKARGDLVAQPFTRFILKEDQDLYYLHRKQLFETGELQSCELRMVRSDGNPFWAHLMATVAQGTDGSPVCRIVLSDITERKGGEAVLQSRVRLLQFAGSHSLTELLRATLDEVEALTDSEVGFYHFVDPDQVTLLLQAWSTNTTQHMCKAEGAGLHYPVDQAGVWVDCIHERRPVVHNDYASLPHRKGLPEGHASVVRELVAPVFRDDRIVAVLGVGNKPTDYNARDIETVSTLADLAWDIAERKLIEHEKEQFYRFFQTSGDMMVIADPNGAFVKTNPACSELLGYSEAEFASRPFIEFIHPEDRQPTLDEVARQIKTGFSLNFENRYLCKDGSARWLSWRATFFKGEGITYATARDITQRKETQDALRMSEERLRDITFSVGDWVWEVDENGVYTHSSQKGVDLFGSSREDVIGKTPFDFMPPDEAKRVGAIFSEIAAKRAPIKDVENWNITKNGERICLLTNGVPILDNLGNLKGYRGVDRDITARRRAEEETAKLQEQLAQAQRMESVGRLAGGVAHDFNNMLGVILGHAELALKQVDSAQPLFADLEEIRKAATRSADITRQLLTFARKQTISPISLNLNDAVEGMLKMLRRLIGEAIHLNWQPGKNLWLVKVDPSQIDQILVNLCVNARDAIADLGTIAIETGNCTFDRAQCAAYTDIVPGDYVRLTVSDTGGGMEQETLALIFEPFFTTKGVGEGTGLGLALVYGAVRQNRGFIRAASAPGQGAKFTIYLPRHAATPDQARKTDPAGSLHRGRETILLVEDEPSILKLTRRLLGMQGYTVMAASTPGEAIRLAREHPGEIHLLMTDVVMPEMNGRDLAKNLRSLYPNIKRLFMSGYTADVIAHHGVLDEGVQFIQKPFSSKDLAAKVRKVLEQA